MTQALIPQAALDDLKARNPCHEIAGRYVVLRRHGKKMIGPCPVCSADRQSRTGTRFECDAESWVCAACADGGDVIALLTRVEGIDFRAAVERLGGTRELDAARTAALDAERAAKEAKRERDATWFRERERSTLFNIWHRGLPIAGTAAQHYLGRRGITNLPADVRLRCQPQMPYYHGQERGEDGRKEARVIHRGPAMLAPIIRPDGHFGGLHLTWIDLTQPNGKAQITDPETGELLAAKKMRGSKRGGYADLTRPAAPVRMIVGEGFEKTLAVWLALHRKGRDLTQTLFRVALDLGNLGGKAAATINHPTLKTAPGPRRAQRAQRVPGPVPDLSEPSIPVPDTVEEIVILGDSTSERLLTECAIARAGARWAA